MGRQVSGKIEKHSVFKGIRVNKKTNTINAALIAFHKSITRVSPLIIDTAVDIPKSIKKPRLKSRCIDAW